MVAAYLSASDPDVICIHLQNQNKSHRSIYSSVQGLKLEKPTALGTYLHCVCFAYATRKERLAKQIHQMHVKEPYYLSLVSGPCMLQLLVSLNSALSYTKFILMQSGAVQPFKS